MSHDMHEKDMFIIYEIIRVSLLTIAFLENGC